MAPTIDEFRRYLQARRNDLDDIADSDERERVRARIDAALQEALDFAAAVEIREELKSRVFEEVDSSARLIEAAESRPIQRVEGDGCPKCDAPLEADIEFCPACGHKP
tara:strand:- start:941 stop:1264 length:324 start_codon:yes stop_codon:yes gene_type:complete